MSLAIRRTRRPTAKQAAEPDGVSGASGLAGQLDTLKTAADTAALPRADGAPSVRGVIRRLPEDFEVREELPFTPSGAGEHLYLNVRKTGQNTRWVGKRLADHAGIPFRSVGFAGLKDRHAVAEQWFSLHLPGRVGPDFETCGIEGIEVLDSVRHDTKLRTGAVRANHFRIVVRDLRGDTADLGARIERLAANGAPNYFGVQRFGRAQRNLFLLFETAKVGREVRSFGLSALRSALFNGYLAGRVRDASWNSVLPGEIAYVPATRRYWHESAAPAGEHAYPTGLLWGCGKNQSTSAALAREREYFSRFERITERLAEFDVRMARRPLVLAAGAVDWRLEPGRLMLRFSLERGAFATSILTELLDVTDGAAAANER